MRSPYSKEQLSTMAVNPFLDGKLVDHYTHLKQILLDAGLTATGDDGDALLRYASLTYDQNSPLVKAHPDQRERKVHAAKLVDYKAPGVRENPKGLEMHMKAIVLFMRNVVKSREWRVICAMEHVFNEFEECLYDGIKKGEDVKDTDIMAAQQKKTALLKEMGNIMNELPALITRFYGDDKQLADVQVKVRTAETMAQVKK